MSLVCQKNQGRNAILRIVETKEKTDVNHVVALLFTFFLC